MRRVAVAAAVVAALAGFVALFRFAARPPAGPVEPAWDRTACAHCRMHLGEPAFAAQLQLAHGEVLFFDDPGCLFAWRDAAADPDRARGRAYFHRHDGAGWLAESEVAFAFVAPTPMGWGLAAVEAAAPGALPLAAAHRRVRERIGLRAPAVAPLGETP